MAIDREQLKELMSDEIDAMEESRLRGVASSRNSFIAWCERTAYRIARAIGEVITFPIRVLEGFFSGLWRGLFG